VLLIYPQVKGCFDAPLALFDFGDGFMLHVVPFPLPVVGDCKMDQFFRMNLLSLNNMQASML